MRARPLVPAGAALLLVALAAPAGAATGRSGAGDNTAGPRSASAPGAPAVRADFNADGIEDLAIGSQLETIDGAGGAGAVHVMLGGAAGLTGTGSQVISQQSPGVTSDPELNDWFGNAIASGDFDGDGFTDIAVASMNESVGSVASAGVVHVFYGSPAGMQTVGSQMFSQDSPGVGDDVELQDQFGVALAAADIDGDAIDDLAVGSHLDPVNGQAQAGVAHVLYGNEGTGIDGAGSTLLSQVGTQVPSEPERRDMFGAAVAAADFDGDGFADVAVGAPGESAGTVPEAGAVNVFDGSASGVTNAGSRIFTQGSPGVGSDPEPGDQLGGALATGDFDGDGFPDLAAGADTEAVTDIFAAGAVNTLRGSAGGLTGVGGQLFHQGVGDIGSDPEQIDQFGDALAAGDFDGDGADDLAIGAFGEVVGTVQLAGAAHVLYGTTGSGLSATGTLLIVQGSGGVGSAPEPGDQLGAAFGAADFDGDGDDDLAIGARGESVGLVDGAGAFHALDGSPSGLTGVGSQVITQDTPGLPDSVEVGDGFGGAFAATRSAAT